jgi:hypothetical protein
MHARRKVDEVLNKGRQEATTRLSTGWTECSVVWLIELSVELKESDDGTQSDESATADSPGIPMELITVDGSKGGLSVRLLLWRDRSEEKGLSPS